MNDDLSSTGKRLKFAFKEAGISYEEAADFLGKSIPTIFRWMREEEAEVPDEILDKLLIKKGISKVFVQKNKGSWKATLEERLSIFDEDLEIQDKIKSIKSNLLLSRLMNLGESMDKEDLEFLNRIGSELIFGKKKEFLRDIVIFCLDLPMAGLKKLRKMAFEIEADLLKNK